MRSQELNKGLLDMIEHINQIEKTSEITMVEIGSYIGESSIVFAQYFKKVICVDPFENYEEIMKFYGDHAEMDLVYHKFLENTKNYPNISNIRAKSDDAYKELKNEQIGFVYIDGLHTYEQVKNDISNYQPLIKGKFIGGHDYSDYWIGVKNAVNRAYSSPDKVFSDTSWIKKIC
jgi:predicted O-methyltransferase YrrM